MIYVIGGVCPASITSEGSVLWIIGIEQFPVPSSLTPAWLSFAGLVSVVRPACFSERAGPLPDLGAAAGAIPQKIIDKITTEGKMPS